MTMNRTHILLVQAGIEALLSIPHGSNSQQALLFRHLEDVLGISNAAK